MRHSASTPAAAGLRTSGSNDVDLTTCAATDEELLRRTAEGDRAALAELVRRGGELPAPSLETIAA